MDLQLGGDVAPVGDDRMGRDAERIGDLLVRHSLHHADYNLPLAGAQRFGFLLPDPVGRQTLDGRNEDLVLDGIVRGELLLAGEDVEKYTVEFVRTARGVVFDDDVLQFAQLGLDLVVLAAEDIDRIGGVFSPESSDST